MRFGIYMYYDRVAETYVQPLCAIVRNDETAIRDFVGALSSDEFPKDKKIGDYDLLRLASYDIMLNRVCEVAVDPTGNPICTGVHVRALKAEAERKRKLGAVEDGDEEEAARELEQLDLISDENAAALRLATSR